MTNFTIKCETVSRLANVCSYFSPRVDEELKEKINVLRIENTENDSLAIITNQAVACVERIGDSQGQTGICDLVLTDELLKQMKTESPFSSVLTITTIPELATSTCMTTMGWQSSNCCLWADETPLDDWRNWAVENAVQSSGSMYWDLDEVEVLFKASPTGKIVFPEFIDSGKPVTLRDRYSPEWVGLFIPKQNKGERITQKAELPKWWRK